MSDELVALALTAASVGSIHTLAGPDHYLPFIALARARNWSASRTAAVTLTCGIGHVAGSLLLASAGVALSWSLGGLESIESWRGALAGWLMIGFGLAYLVWGIRHAQRGRSHTHWHSHADGTLHSHEHDHLGEHGHVHEPESQPRGTLRRVTPWALFLVFVLGPCEPLIPLFVVPAASRSWDDLSLIAAAFAATTLITMVAAVLVGRLGIARLPGRPLERWSHAAAGAVLTVCGLALRLGM